jgi:glycosyltransferase involved in cell wall biosynthesis
LRGELPVKIAHYAAPDGCSRAYRTLSDGFPAIMTRVGYTVEVVHSGMLPGSEPDFVTYAIDVQPEPMRAFPNAIHLQPFVDGDIAPTKGVLQVVPSVAWGKWMMEKYGDYPLHVIPNWVDPGLWPMGTGEDGYIAYVGRLWKSKMGILNELAAAMPDRRFVVAGSGRDLRAGPNVENRGQLQPADVCKLFQGAAVVVCPSTYCEPFGLAAVEAGLCGARVVASRKGAFLETLPPGSLVGGDSLSDWVCEIWHEDDGDRAARRRHHIAQHSPEVAGVRYADLLDRLATSK